MTPSTREEQLALIRKACIAANPEIAKLEVNTRIGVGKLQTIAGWEPRPIRLTDVLLTMQEAGDWFFSGAAEGMLVFESADVTDGVKFHYWNLRKDDLTEQSDETITFLADLLQ